MSMINNYKITHKYTHKDSRIDWFVVSDGGLWYVATKNKALTRREKAYDQQRLYQSNGSMSLNLDFLSTKAKLHNTHEEAEIAAIQELSKVIGKGWTNFKIEELAASEDDSDLDDSGYYFCADLQ